MVEEEADESGYWMEMIIESGMMEMKLVQPLLKEANELVAIMTSSRISAARNRIVEERALREKKLPAKKPIKNQKSKI